MKIRFLVALTTLGLVFITSCKKNKEESETTSTPPDVTAPMLSLSGANPLIVDLIREVIRVALQLMLLME